MAKAKKKVKPVNKSVRSVPVLKHKVLEKEPSYMVQISDPKMLRKDLLETLREIIIFMQGYEKFRQIQAEKVATFNQLRSEVQGLNSLINNKLRRHLPRGKLKSVRSKKEEEPQLRDERQQTPSAAPRLEREAPTPPPNELDELEAQLRDIEGQLRRVQ